MSPIHVVLFVALTIWAGLFAYLWRLDARLKGIQRLVEQGAPIRVVEAPMAVIEPQPEVSRKAS